MISIPWISLREKIVIWKNWRWWQNWIKTINILLKTSIILIVLRYVNTEHDCPCKCHPRFIVAHHFNFLCFAIGVKFLFSSCVFCAQCFQCLLMETCYGIVIICSTYM
jgi:hypothetical protein